MSGLQSDGTAPIRRIGLREFQANIDDILHQAHQGASFLVTSQDEVLAEIRPPAPSLARRRRPGAMRGRISIADDFDRLPPELLSAMEDGDT